MPSIRMSPNSREVIGAISTITSKQEYLKSTNGALNVAGSFSLSGQAIPASGLTTAVAVQIVDGSGNQITSFGGGTQYTDGNTNTSPATGPTLMYDNDGSWQHVSLDDPLPVLIPGAVPLSVTVTDGDVDAPASGIVSFGQNASNVVHPLQLDVSGNLLTKINVALPAGSNVIGHVITDTGSTTAVTGTVAVSGTVTANAGTNLNTSLLALESGGNLATLAGTVTSSVLQTNEKQINGVVPLMGNGVTGTGSQRVTIASDNTAFSVNATLSAETTKVIGVVRNADGSGNLLTSTTNALDVNLKTSSLSNQSVNVAQINGVTPLMGNGVTGTGSQRVTIASDNTAFSVNATLSAETTKVIGVTRTADGSGNLITSTANALDVNIKSGFGTSITANQGTAAALSGGWPVINGEASDSTGTFTNATQTTSVTASSLDGYGNVLISITGTYGTATAVFEGSDDGGTTWFGISEADRTDSNVIESGYTSLSNTLRAWQISNPGWDAVRVRSTAVASGTVNVRISPSAAPTSAGASVSIGVALPTGANTIGAVNQGTSPWIVAGGGTAGSAASGVVTIQGIASMTKLLVTPDSVALPANQSVNVSQINAVTPLMGNGVTGTGSQRVTIASDNTVLPGVGAGATGSAPPANAAYAGLQATTALPTAASNGNLVGASSDKFGRQVIVTGTIRDLRGSQRTAITSSTAETTIVTQTASVFNDLIMVLCANTSATATQVDFRDTTGGTILFSLEVPANGTAGFQLTGESWPQTTVNTNWTAQSSNSIASLIVSVLFEKNK